MKRPDYLRDDAAVRAGANLAPDALRPGQRTS